MRGRNEIDFDLRGKLIFLFVMVVFVLLNSYRPGVISQNHSMQQTLP